MEFGLVTGGSTTQGVETANRRGIHLVRVYDLLPTDSVATVEAIVNNCRLNLIEPILLVNTDEVADMVTGNVAAWAARVGPGGTYWTSNPSFNTRYAPRWIEWGNEFSYAYRQIDPESSGWYNAEGYETTARTLAAGAVAAQTAINASNPNMKVIMEAEDGGSGSSNWIDWIFDEEPSIASVLDGFTIHAYGPKAGSSYGVEADNYPRVGTMVSRLNAKGAASAKVFITEVGISTDNGTTMNPDNLDWVVNLTYNNAALAMAEVVNDHMSESYASRIAVICWYKAIDDSAPGANTNRENYFGIENTSEAAKGNMATTATSFATNFSQQGFQSGPVGGSADLLGFGR